MNNLLFNIRFGAKHLQIARDIPYFSIVNNSYWAVNKPDSWFKVYCWFGKIYT